MKFWNLFRPAPPPAEALYRAIVTAARQPHFYAEWGVPDTVDGRFDMIVVHLFLVLDRLRHDPGAATATQALTDAFYTDMDRSLREMGVGDLSVGKKVRKMAEACQGRLEAYGKATAAGEKELASAVARNLFPEASGAKGATEIARWMLAARKHLETLAAEDICQGKVSWP
jgi:cytochrome b pre-mRNA-processing protein 3